MMTTLAACVAVLMFVVAMVLSFKSYLGHPLPNKAASIGLRPALLFLSYRRNRPGIAGKNHALFRQLISVRVSRNVLMQRRVLACFDPQWPNLELAVA